MIKISDILGMDSQFDVVSSAIQDTLGEPYDYKSVKLIFILNNF